MKLMRSLLLLSAATLLATAQAGAQKASTALFTRTEGDLVRAVLEIEIEDDWHLYHTELGNPEAVGKPTILTLGGAGIRWGAPRFPEPEVLVQPGMAEDGGDGWIWGHGGTIAVYALGRLDPGADAAAATAEIAGLTCLDDGACILYRESVARAGRGADALFASFPTDLEAPPGAPPGASPGAEAGETGSGEQLTADWTTAQQARFRFFTRVVDGDLRAVLEVRVDKGWHLYHTDLGDPEAAAKPLVLAFEGAGIGWGEPRLPEPEVLLQEAVGGWVYAHHGAFSIHAVGALAPGATGAGAAVVITGLTCMDDGACKPIKGLRIESSGAGSDELFASFPADLAPGAAPTGAVDTSVEGPENGGTGSETGAAAAGSGPDDLEWDYAPREAGIGAVTANGDGDGAGPSILKWMLLAFVAGMILNVMPCVLPVVSIKVLSFVNQAGESRGRIFALGLMFSAGILSVFLVLGALAIFVGLNWGEQFQSTTFLVVLIGVVFAFALSLFGVFEVGVPQAVGQMAGQNQRREGLASAFSMGILSTLLATPCSGPFLGSTLAWAVSQPATVVLAIFGMAGLGMAAPYAVLTSNPAFLRYVPKPGPWMETFKHAMGFLLLFTVLFLLTSLPADRLLLVATFMVFVGMGCWVWGHFATFAQSRAKHAVTLAWAVLVIAGGAWLSFAGFPRFFAEKEIWEEFDVVKLERYHREGRNVFVDWTADWCLTCKTNEKVVYESAAVVDLLRQKGVAAMKADETEGQPDLEVKRALRNHLGSQSIPFAAIFPGNEPQRPWTLRDIVRPSDFVELLESLPDK